MRELCSCSRLDVYSFILLKMWLLAPDKPQYCRSQGDGAEIIPLHIKWFASSYIIYVAYHRMEPVRPWGRLMHCKELDLVYSPPLLQVMAVQFEPGVYVFCYQWPWILHWSILWVALLCLLILVVVWPPGGNIPTGFHITQHTEDAQ